MGKVFIIPAPLSAGHPAAARPADGSRSRLDDRTAMEGIGEIVEVNAWEQPHLREEIRRLIAERKPDWVIAAGASATACLPLHGQRKVLVNPRVTAADLEGVPEYALRHTYGFFGALPEQEESYGLFQTVYPHAAWYACVPDLRLADIRELAVSIIAGGQTD